MPTFAERIKNSWNAFLGRDWYKERNYQYGGLYNRPDRARLSKGNDKSVVASVYNQISVDVSLINFRHVRVDKEGNYKEDINDGLNRIFSINANIDQPGRQFVQDIVLTMVDEGCAALVPVDTDVNPLINESFDIYSCRVGKIIAWLPQDVTVEVYNDQKGQKEQITLPKRIVPIIENPFYAIMNEPNSTLQRLIRVLNQIDRLNEQNAAGKMDLIIQVPYSIKGQARKNMAEERRHDIEAQLTGSQYGIAYIDGTERVIQLNRAVENNLWNQAKDLMEQLFAQLGMAKAVFDGTADEKVLLNYYNRTIDPICARIIESIRFKWLTKTAITQGQDLMYFRDAFKLVPLEQMAELADKFTRNEIMTKNEFRSKIGMKPSDDPKANELRNSNINHPEDMEGEEGEEEEEELGEEFEMDPDLMEGVDELAGEDDEDLEEDEDSEDEDLE